MAWWLLVDDDPTDREILREALDRVEGVDGEVVASGSDVLDRLEGGASPSLVVLDLGLPDIAGCEIIAQIRERTPTATLPIVVLSGNADLNVVDYAYRNGANVYFRKPASMAETAALLQQIHEHWDIAAVLPGRPVSPGTV